MPQFNYLEKLIAIPDEWKQTNGQGVKIALIDKGANLSISALSHFDLDGHKFDVTTDDFDPASAAGNDDVSDATPNSDLHGTQLLSILGAGAADEEGIVGIAKDAEIFIIKIQDSNKETRQEYLQRALELCIRLDVDIISNSSFPRITNTADLPKFEDLMTQLESKNIIFVSALKNSTLPRRFNKLGFPTKLGYALPTGVPQKEMLQKLPNNFGWTKSIQLLFPELNIKCYTASNNSTGQTIAARSSHATACLSGILALQIAHWKAIEDDFERRTKAQLITVVTGVCPKFSKTTLINNPKFQFYQLNQNNT